MSTRASLIRNFSIIAHIDHGKTTLSDRLIETCGGLSSREMGAQVLDSMELERERGITIKAQSVTLRYQAKDGQVYELNFIDTPGHVDFSYEVSRSLFACEGALLVVDASQGVEAQTVANCYKAIDLGLSVVPVLNKIDLPQAEPERVKEEIEEVIGLEAQDAVLVSAKTGLGIQDLLEAVVARIPPPQGNPEAPLQALIIDSWFDEYLGVVVLVRIKEGRLSVADRIRIFSTGELYRVDALGVFTPKREPKESLEAGQVGYIVAAVRDIHGAPVGDTIVSGKDQKTPALSGFQKVKPVVYAGLFPIQTDDYGAFREALEKLVLNDASLSFEPESADALGRGFRCGFLGLLHMEIILERLEREYRLDIIATAPSVVYQAKLRNGNLLNIHKSSDFPQRSDIEEVLEPIAAVSILTPESCLGRVMELCSGRRGVQKSFLYAGRQVSLQYDIPLSEVVTDFFDALKSLSHGYASCDFSFSHMLAAPLLRVDILVGGEPVGALSFIAHEDAARSKAVAVLEVLKEEIPRQQFEIPLQAAIGGKILARETIKAYRKNVLAKCYGGDISRKRKLLEKQKEGKKRMKRIGNVDLPQEAFLSVLGGKRDKKGE